MFWGAMNTKITKKKKKDWRWTETSSGEILIISVPVSMKTKLRDDKNVLKDSQKMSIL